MNTYQQLLDQYLQLLQKAKQRYNLVSLFRLLLAITFIVAGYYYTIHQTTMLLSIVAVCALGFALLIRVHDRLRRKKEMFEALVDVNEAEMAYLSQSAIPFDNGVEFAESTHPYSHDIDIFGEQSLFHHINRTATFPGKQRLAQLFMAAEQPKTILENQEAVEELKDKIDFRQKITARANIKRDSPELYQALLHWTQGPNPKLAESVLIAAYVLPLLFLGLFVTRLVLGPGLFGSLALYSFILNLAVLYAQLKLIKQQIVGADKVKDIIAQYGLIIADIEKESFEGAKLRALQALLKVNNGLVSQELSRLSRMFSSLDAIQNVVGAILFNGFALYHIHVLKGLLDWKKNHAADLERWLKVIAEVEALMSLANLAYNQPSYCFPSINETGIIEFKGLGHPLLNSKNRVDNDVSFEQHPFIILTGSNMSGKSTFLRALGVNMVLAGMGSVICAQSANIQPLALLVSMRLTDSLADSESYFFAEVKRLKEIMEALQGQRAFILLDEILRGTNSDDKRNGTIQVIRKMIKAQAIGAIATHDLEVCKTTEEFPEYLINKAFEVEIIDNELHFDYQLRNGICQNQSATFLMTKMGVI